MDPVIQFVVAAILIALALGVITKFPDLDRTAVQFVRIVLLLILAIMCLNLVLTMLFGHGITFYTGRG